MQKKTLLIDNVWLHVYGQVDFQTLNYRPSIFPAMFSRAIYVTKIKYL